MEFDQLRQMPHSIEAEQSVIGSMIVNPACVDTVIGMLKPQHFYVAKYAQVYEAILAMSMDNRQIDFVTVLDEVQKLGIYDEAEGKKVLYDLAQMVPTTANV